MTTELTMQEQAIVDAIGHGDRVYFINETVKASPALRRKINALVKRGTFSVQFDGTYPKPQKYWVNTYYTQCAA